MSKITETGFYSYLIFCLLFYIIGFVVFYIMEKREKGKVDENWYIVVGPTWSIVWIIICILSGIMLVLMDII